MRQHHQVDAADPLAAQDRADHPRAGIEACRSTAPPPSTSITKPPGPSTSAASPWPTSRNVTRRSGSQPPQQQPGGHGAGRRAPAARPAAEQQARPGRAARAAASKTAGPPAPAAAVSPTVGLVTGTTGAHRAKPVGQPEREVGQRTGQPERHAARRPGEPRPGGIPARPSGRSPSSSGGHQQQVAQRRRRRELGEVMGAQRSGHEKGRPAGRQAPRPASAEPARGRPGGRSLAGRQVARHQGQRRSPTRTTAGTKRPAAAAARSQQEHRRRAGDGAGQRGRPAQRSPRRRPAPPIRAARAVATASPVRSV